MVGTFVGAAWFVHAGRLTGRFLGILAVLGIFRWLQFCCCCHHFTPEEAWGLVGSVEGAAWR